MSKIRQEETEEERYIGQEESMCEDLKGERIVVFKEIIGVLCVWIAIREELLVR